MMIIKKTKISKSLRPIKIFPFLHEEKLLLYCFMQLHSSPLMSCILKRDRISVLNSFYVSRMFLQNKPNQCNVNAA